MADPGWSGTGRPRSAREIQSAARARAWLRMAVFDVYTIHGSNPNPTASPRIGYALRFMPATSHYDHHDLPIPDSRGSVHHTRPLIQVRGRDVSGRNDFTIGHPRAGGGESGPPTARAPGEPYASRVRASGRGSGRAAGR